MTQPHPATLERERDSQIPAYVDLHRLAYELSWGESTIEAKVRLGQFPKPINKGGKRVWKWSTVEKYMDAPDDEGDELAQLRESAKRVSHGRD